MKPYTPEELQGHKEKLANVSIEIAPGIAIFEI